ncbi:unnamed protein product [Hermetia illucens]|uniref:Uncharacterized protein n=1 Tax=Hermetia illucens TaxID=343691 RepID=A0A7R8YM58_HERIL|nr:unnamed protein product [Hermetia illucens]
MEFNRKISTGSSPSVSRASSVSTLVPSSPNKCLYQNSLARNLELKSVNQLMPNQSTPVVGRSYAKNSGADVTFHCARKSLDKLEVQLSRMSNAKRLSHLAVMDEVPDRRNDELSIKNMMLEAEVERLNWRLEVAQNSQEMYHKVMQEMVRFLQQCSQDLDPTQSSSDSSLSIDARDSIKSGESSDEVFKPAVVARFKKYDEFYTKRSKRVPEPPASIRLGMEASRLLRTAENLVNTMEFNLKEPFASNSGNSESEEIPQSPLPSFQRKTLFRTPMRKTVGQPKKQSLWDNNENRRLSLPVVKTTKSRKEQLSSTEDEGLGGSVKSLYQADTKMQTSRAGGISESLIASKRFAKKTLSIDTISKESQLL